jgi:hypothetical protein
MIINKTLFKKIIKEEIKRILIQEGEIKVNSKIIDKIFYEIETEKSLKLNEHEYGVNKNKYLKLLEFKIKDFLFNYKRSNVTSYAILFLVLLQKEEKLNNILRMFSGIPSETRIIDIPNDFSAIYDAVSHIFNEEKFFIQLYSSISNDVNASVWGSLSSNKNRITNKNDLSDLFLVLKSFSNIEINLNKNRKDIIHHEVQHIIQYLNNYIIEIGNIIKKDEFLREVKIIDIVDKQKFRNISNIIIDQSIAKFSVDKHLRPMHAGLSSKEALTDIRSEIDIEKFIKIKEKNLISIHKNSILLPIIQIIKKMFGIRQNSQSYKETLIEFKNKLYYLDDLEFKPLISSIARQLFFNDDVKNEIYKNIILNKKISQNDKLITSIKYLFLILKDFISLNNVYEAFYDTLQETNRLTEFNSELFVIFENLLKEEYNLSYISGSSNFLSWYNNIK